MSCKGINSSRVLDDIIEEVHASDRVADSKAIQQEAVSIECMVVSRE